VIGRTYRTIRHLTPEQIAARAIRRGRRALFGLFPDAGRRHLAERAGRLPLPDPALPLLARAAEPVAALHRGFVDRAAIAAGRFTLLGHTFDFGSPESIDWRGDFDEGSNPLRRMTLAYLGDAVALMATGRAEDAALALRLLQSFEDANLPLAAPLLRDVWHAYAASHRLINLLAGAALHLKAGGTAADALRRMCEHARLCAALVLADRERDLGYNHLLKNDVALAVFAAGCGTVPPDIRFLRASVPRAVARCVLADGGHAERSPMYHALGLIDLRILAATGLWREAWQPALDEAIARMEEALSVVTHPDGEIALFNDSWRGGAPSSAELIGAPDRIPPGVRRLPVTGYVRLGGAYDAALFDCGPVGPDENPAHAHADFLAVEVSVAGRRFIVDTGVPTYTAGPERDASRSAGAHNGPRVAGAEPMEPWASFRVGRRGAAWELRGQTLDGVAPMWCAGAQSGYQHRGITVARYVGLYPNQGMLICDVWRGRADGPEESRFLVPASWTPATARGLSFAMEGVHVAAEALVGTLSAPNPAQHWLRYGVPALAHIFAIAPRPEAAARRTALWLAWGRDARPPEAAELSHLFDALTARSREGKPRA
jgi:uncharacterized heparinase superfamily protein